MTSPACESVVAVAERLGHENATLVLKTYGHLMPDGEDRTRRAIDDAWSDGLQRPPIMGIRHMAWSEACFRSVAGVGFEPLRRTFQLGAMPRNAFSLGILLLGIARPYS
jgi:hypothetical protein